MKPFNYSLNNFNCFTTKHVCKTFRGIELLDLKTYFCTSDTDKHKKEACLVTQRDKIVTAHEQRCLACYNTPSD